MFGNVTALEGLHVTGNYRYRSMQHTCSRHAAWDPQGGWCCSGQTAPHTRMAPGPCSNFSGVICEEILDCGWKASVIRLAFTSYIIFSRIIDE